MRMYAISHIMHCMQPSHLLPPFSNIKDFNFALLNLNFFPLNFKRRNFGAFKLGPGACTSFHAMIVGPSVYNWQNERHFLFFMSCPPV